MTVEQLLSWKETMQALDVSSPTLYAIVGRNELQPAEVRQIGRQERKFFSPADVEALRRKRSGEQVETV